MRAMVDEFRIAEKLKLRELPDSATGSAPTF
jgi:hypothetical protein